MKRIIKIAGLILLSLQVAFGQTVKDRDSAAKWFNENETEIHELMACLLAHPNIQRVEDTRMDFVPKYGDFSDADLDAYNSVLKASERLGVEAISVTRRGNAANGELIAINFLLISEGLTTRGYALEVAYIPDSDFVVNDRARGIFHHPLKSNWYIAEYINK